MNILFNMKTFWVIAVLIIVIGLSFTEEANINVEIKGEVEAPGVYRITEPKIVEELLNQAKLTANADTSQLNLSKKVYDEMVIIVPKKAEKKEAIAYKIIETSCVCPKVTNDACLNPVIPKDEIITSTKLSLNNATKEELMTLPGIGESKAEAIITYRKNKTFETIEEIMQVKGIGKSIYEKLKDFITP